MARATEAVPDNNAKYNKAYTKVDLDKGAIGITTADHGIANENVAMASSGKLERQITDEALADE